MLFHLSNAAMLPLAGGGGDPCGRAIYANLIIAAASYVPQVGRRPAVAPHRPRRRAGSGRRPIAAAGLGGVPLRGLLLAILPGAWPLVAGQAVSGISAAAFGVLLPLLASDLTLGTAHFNLCMGMLGLAAYIGAAISTTLSGGIADSAGMQMAFFVLAGIGLAAFAAVFLTMPETRPARGTD